MADGSVGDAKDASNKESGIKNDTKVNFGPEMTSGPSNIKEKTTNKNANSASKRVIKRIDFPIERIFGKNNVPPTEKVIKDKAIFVTSVVCATNALGIKWVKSGLSSRPARI